MERSQTSLAVVILAATLVGPAVGQQITRISVGTSGAEADRSCTGAEVSADGRFVAFVTDAGTLVPGDGNAALDVFVRDLVAGTTERVSVGSAGAEGDGDSAGASISADGRYVAFTSSAANLVAGDTNGVQDVFLHDRGTGITTRISVDWLDRQAGAPSGPARISADGRYVAFASAAELAPGDTNGTSDVFVRDLATGAVERVSVDSGGREAHGASDCPSISSDGRWVAFHSVADEFEPGDYWGYDDVFVHDRLTGTTTLVSVGFGHGQQAYGYNRFAEISADGRHVAFSSDAPNLVPVDDNGTVDVFVRDLALETTTLATVSSTGAQADGQSYGASISASGRFVTFHSLADNLVPLDTNGNYDVFLRDLETGETSLVGVNAAGVQGSGANYEASISDDGRFVAFRSSATNLVPQDTNAYNDVFLRDLGSPQATAFCASDAVPALCPCGNAGWPGQGCDDATGTGGAALLEFGAASLADDDLVLVASGVRANAPAILVQGDAQAAPVTLGFGQRCAAGRLERLFVAHASAGGIVSVPAAGDPSISARASALGDPIAGGTRRYYQAIYRDAPSEFCAPVGGVAWNLTSGRIVAWRP